MSTSEFKSIWDAIEDTDAARANMKARAEIMIALQQLLEKQAGTQGRKAKKLGITQPRLNDLLRGRIDKFSLDALVNLASRAGLKIRFRIGQAA